MTTTRMKKRRAKTARHTKPTVAYVDDRAVPFRGAWADVMEGIAHLEQGPAHGTAR